MGCVEVLIERPKTLNPSNLNSQLYGHMGGVEALVANVPGMRETTIPAEQCESTCDDSRYAMVPRGQVRFEWYKCTSVNGCAKEHVRRQHMLKARGGYTFGKSINRAPQSIHPTPWDAHFFPVEEGKILPTKNRFRAAR